MAEALSDIDDQVHDAGTKLKRLTALFQSTLDGGNRMCLCGIFAADCSTLDPESRAELRESFNDHEIWLTRILTAVKKKGEPSFAGKPQDESRFVISSLKGSILIARTHEDKERFETAARQSLARLATPARCPARGDMQR